MRHLLHLGVVRFQEKLVRPRKIFHDLFVLAVLGDDFLEFRMLLGDFLETRGIAHDLRRRKLLRHLLVARVELVQFFSQGKNGHGKSSWKVEVRKLKTGRLVWGAPQGSVRRVS